MCAFVCMCVCIWCLICVCVLVYVCVCGECVIGVAVCCGGVVGVIGGGGGDVACVVVSGDGVDSDGVVGVAVAADAVVTDDGDDVAVADDDRGRVTSVAVGLGVVVVGVVAGVGVGGDVGINDVLGGIGGEATINAFAVVEPDLVEIAAFNLLDFPPLDIDRARVAGADGQLSGAHRIHSPGDLVAIGHRDQVGFGVGPALGGPQHQCAQQTNLFHH